MAVSRNITGLVLTAAVSVLGCASSSHWSSQPPTGGPPETPPPASQATPYPSTSPAESDGQRGEVSGADPQALLDVMAEVRRVGALDPAAEAELLKNLRQTRPELWPLVTQQFRAALSYRQKLQESPAADGGMNAIVANTALPCPAPATELAEAPAPRVAALPTPGTPEVPNAGVDDRQVSPASYADATNSYQAHLDEAVRLLESKVNASPTSSDEIAAQARLRLLYLLSGRRDEALKPIPAVPPGTQDFWTNEFYGLSALLNGASDGSPSRLAAEAQRPLDEAVARLAESCPLVVSNLAFVTDVQSYGVFKRFEKYEFQPGQRVLLYAEVANFTSTESEKGFHTSLTSSYQIFEPGGRRVADHKFEANNEFCRNRRRDFFIGYEFCLPTRVYPGKHVLKLTVEDVASGKVGESSIEFTVLADEE